jgi:murein L,D-transpeptidase YcbB/YkuD
MKLVKRFAAVFAVFFSCFQLFAAGNGTPVIIEKLRYAKLVERFYELRESQLFWFADNESSLLRQRIKSILDSSVYVGLDKSDYHYKWITSNLEDSYTPLDSTSRLTADKIFTDALISFCKDMYGGADIKRWLSYDELSAKHEVTDDAYILSGLSLISSPNELEWFVHFLEPGSEDYTEMRQELRQHISFNDKMKTSEVSQTLNMLRWIKHFGFKQFILVNPASAMLRYYVADTLNLRMKIVVGTPQTPTPRFAGYCDQVILYPYWNVPYSIAVKEMLPAIKRSRSYLDTRNLQVIDNRGRIIDPASLNWSSFSARYFPYQLRQSTGCDNALGVIKFNLTDPFSVYMHDTNNKTAFLAGARYFSHGCIRLEKPVELATALLPGKINAAFLEACEKNQKPVPLKIGEPVPVFVVYMTAEYDEAAGVKYYKDVYKIFN